MVLLVVIFIYNLFQKFEVCEPSVISISSFINLFRRVRVLKVRDPNMRLSLSSMVSVVNLLLETFGALELDLGLKGEADFPK